MFVPLLKHVKLAGQIRNFFVKLFLFFEPNFLFVNMELNPLFPIVISLVSIGPIRVPFLEWWLSLIKRLASGWDRNAPVFPHEGYRVVDTLDPLIEIFFKLEWLRDGVFTEA